VRARRSRPRGRLPLSQGERGEAEPEQELEEATHGRRGARTGRVGATPATRRRGGPASNWLGVRGRTRCYGAPPRDACLVIGCGGLTGGVIAGELARDGRGISTVVTTNRDVRARRSSARADDVRDRRRRFTVRVRITEALDAADQPFESWCWATYPAHRPWRPRSPPPPPGRPDGRVVCVRTGSARERVARVVGVERVGRGSGSSSGPPCPSPAWPSGRAGGVWRSGNWSPRRTRSSRRCGTCSGLLGVFARPRTSRGCAGTSFAVNCAMSTFGTIGGEPVGV
jgi:2-dehydropantoate 2-reductase